MFKQICPHCLKPVSIPDDVVGKDATCPACGKPFAVHARYEPVVASDPPVVPPPPKPPEPVLMSAGPDDRPPPPPGYVPPPPPVAYTSPAFSASPLPATPDGYSRSLGCSIRPQVMAWVPAICLTGILILTLSGWVGSYVGGHPVYSQSPWGAMVGTVWRNFQLEDIMKRQATWPSKVLDKVRSDWELMVPYLLTLILAVILAWAERFVATLDATRLPPPLRWVGVVWPYRGLVLAVLSIATLVLLLTQLAGGFGLERAMKKAVGEAFAEARQKAGGSPSELEAIDFQEEQELAKYHLQRTTWLYLAFTLHILTVLALVVRAALDRRGNKPPPRIVLQY